ncbi:MAG: sel1 repeat family protein [Lachnospiraceae bacterium]|nr:sel1 repeat family protein [Lachnospiraceae bacterium]
MAQNGEEHYREYRQHAEEGQLQSAGLSLLTSAICGYLPAQAELGYKYLKGIMFPKDYTQAMRWLDSAAQGKDPASMTHLATMYMYGYGTKTNGKKALELLQEAWEQGYGEAARMIGVCHEKGIGVPKSAEEAALWYRRSAECGTADHLPEA